MGHPGAAEAVAAWFARRRGVPGLDPDGVLPTIGSKELVAWLPTLLGIGAGDVVAFPDVAYPTYDVGARIAGATPLPMRSLTALGPLTTRGTPKLLWLNSPGNPTGQVLPVEHLRQGRRLGPRSTAWSSPATSATPSSTGAARGRGAPGRCPSILDPRVCGGSHDGLLAVYSLSKQCNLAGYRAAFVAGDPALVRRLLEVRKHAGMIVPVAGAAGHGRRPRRRRPRGRAEGRATRTAPRGAADGRWRRAGFRIDHSDAGLYLWATRGEDAWATVGALADAGHPRGARQLLRRGRARSTCGSP